MNSLRMCRMIAGVVVAVTAFSASAHARQTDQTPFEVTQPDGTRVTLYGAGDEFASWYEDANGYSVVLVGLTYCYATVGPDGQLAGTSLVAGAADPKAAGLRPHLHPQGKAVADAQAKFRKLLSARMNTTGQMKMLVVAIRFKNHKEKNRQLPGKAEWEALFNTSERSLKAYYGEMSYGKLQLESVVSDWVDVSSTEAEAKTNLEPALREALQKANEEIKDFKQFDANGDGVVDIMTFVHSGYEGASQSNDADGAPYTQRIHSHASSISETFVASDGTKVQSYNINAGLDGLSGSKIATVNTPIHEVGHVLGLPDLYDTDYTSTGVGTWSVMASSDGPGGAHVPLMDPWCRTKMGWLSPIVITADGQYEAKDAAGSTQVYKIQNGYPEGEYLLIENRQPGRWETNLPGGKGGILIWHVDEKKGSLEENNVNNDEGHPGQADFAGNSKHYRVALVQADGLFELEKKENSGDLNDMFRGDGGRNAVGPNTTPNLKTYQGGKVENSNVRISDISAEGATMTFKAALNNTPTVSEAAGITTSSRQFPVNARILQIAQEGDDGGGSSGDSGGGTELPGDTDSGDGAGDDSGGDGATGDDGTGGDGTDDGAGADDGTEVADPSDSYDGDANSDFSDEALPNEFAGAMEDNDDPVYIDEAGDGIMDDDPNDGGMDDGTPDNAETIDFSQLGGAASEFAFDDDPSDDDVDGDGVNDNDAYGFDYGDDSANAAARTALAAKEYLGDGSRFVIPFAIADDETTDVSKLKIGATSSDQSVVANADIQVVVPPTQALLDEARAAGREPPAGCNCILVITMRTTGLAEIRLTVGDGTTRKSRKFTIDTRKLIDIAPTPLPFCGNGAGFMLAATATGLMLVRFRRRQG